jgi:hypothetical protein
MKCSTLGIAFLTALFINSPSFAVVGYLGSTITQHDVLGCQNSNNPRCKNIVKVACKSICFGQADEDSDFTSACKNLCQLHVKPVEPALIEPKSLLK